MVPAGRVLIYPRSGQGRHISSCLFNRSFTLFNLIMTSVLLCWLSAGRDLLLYSLCVQSRPRDLIFPVLLSLLQEESSVKPDKQGPHSRFGRSTEDLTNASKQVRTANAEMQDPCWFYCMSVFMSLKARRNIFNYFL